MPACRASRRQTREDGRLPLLRQLWLGLRVALGPAIRDVQRAFRCLPLRRRHALRKVQPGRAAADAGRYQGALPAACTAAAINVLMQI